jgi:hypothetical protein
MSREQETQLVQRWVDAVYSEQSFTQAEYAEFDKFISDSGYYLPFYNLEWPEFKAVDEFPFSSIYLDECIENCLNQDMDDDEIIESFRIILDDTDLYNIFYLTEIVAGDGRSAWVLISSHSMGQLGVVDTMAGLFPSLLAAEESLREDGYIFTGNTPSGKIDTFTDEQIIEMVRKAEKS